MGRLGYHLVPGLLQPPPTNNNNTHPIPSHHISPRLVSSGLVSSSLPRSQHSGSPAQYCTSAIVTSICAPLRHTIDIRLRPARTNRTPCLSCFLRLRPLESCYERVSIACLALLTVHHRMLTHGCAALLSLTNDVSHRSVTLRKLERFRAPPTQPPSTF